MGGKQKTKKGEIKKGTQIKVQNSIRRVVKRSGEIVPFNQKKVTEAVYKAFRETNEAGMKEARQVSGRVVIETTAVRLAR